MDDGGSGGKPKTERERRQRSTIRRVRISPGLLLPPLSGTYSIRGTCAGCGEDAGRDGSRGVRNVILLLCVLSELNDFFRRELPVPAAVRAGEVGRCGSSRAGSVVVRKDQY